MLHEHVVYLLTSEHVYLLAVDRSLGIDLNLSVLILLGGNGTTNRLTILTAKRNLIVEVVNRTLLLELVFLIQLLLHSSLLLILGKACHGCIGGKLLHEVL